MGEQKTILIIDDDVDHVEATKVVLKDRYQVLVAYNGTEGRAVLKENQPDLIILDMMMDRKGEGYIFSREIRKDPRFAQTPIILLTSMREQTGFFPVEPDARHPRYLPVNEIIEKPIEPQVLLKKIEKLIQKPGNSSTALPGPTKDRATG
jgi:CheY-like chemotaxis protein